MNILVSDSQTIGGSSATVFEMIQTGAVSALVTLANKGTNTANFTFQEKINGTWTDMGTLGQPLNNTLTAGQVVALAIAAGNPQVRIVANASGGTEFEFAVLRHFIRESGGPIPILTL